MLTVAGFLLIEGKRGFENVDDILPRHKHGFSDTLVTGHHHRKNMDQQCVAKKAKGHDLDQIV